MGQNFLDRLYDDLLLEDLLDFLGERSAEIYVQGGAVPDDRRPR